MANAKPADPSGGDQLVLDFAGPLGGGEAEGKLAPVVPLRPRGSSSPVEPAEPSDDWTAQEWYEEGGRVEASDPEAAIAAYRRALELEPDFFDAHVDLGRCLHEQERPADAEGHYRAALRAAPEDPTAWFNLGVSLEDQERRAEALEAYRRALEIDPEIADALFNAARIYEAIGDPAAAVRCLKLYRKLASRTD